MSKRWLGLLLLMVSIGSSGAAHAAVTEAPDPLDIGSVSVTKSGTADATLSDTGQTMNVTVRLRTGGDCPQFQITSPTSPVTVGPGAGNDQTVSVKFTPTSQGTKTCTIDVKQGPTVLTSFAVTGIGDQGVVATTPTSHDFAGVPVGMMVPFNFTLKNTGNVPINNLTGALADTTKGYVFDPATVPTSLAGGMSVPLTVTFAPQSGSDGGPVNLTFNAVWDASNIPTTASLALNGDGQIASFTVTPNPLAFGNFRFEPSPPAKTYQITNNGDLNVSIDTTTFMADPGTDPTEFTFTPAQPLPHTLTAGQTLDVTVVAKPNNRIGPIGGTVTVHSGTAGTTDQVLTITGNATAAAVTATATVDFGAVNVDVPPPPQKINIKNTGTAPLDITSFTLMNADPAFTFTLPGTPLQIAPNGSIDIPVNYKPTNVRPPGDFDTATLVANLGGVLHPPGMPNTPVTSMTLCQGRGIDSSLVVQAMPIFPQAFRNPGSKAPIRAVTVHNNGEAVLHITEVSVTGDPAWKLVDTTAIDIPGGSSHDFMVKFAPLEVGSAFGQLVLVNNNHARPTAMVTLKSTCMPRNIAFGPVGADPLAPPPISFQFTRAGLPIKLADILAVTNQDASVPFTIHAIQLDDNPAFQLEEMPADLALPSGAQETFGITFTPMTVDHFETIAHLYIDEDPVPQANIKITGDAVFVDAHGSGGCNAGGAGGGGGLAIGLAALGAFRRRRRRRAGLTLAAAVAALAFAPAARADGIALSVFEPTPATTGTGFALQAPDVGASGSWVASVIMSHATNPLVLESFTFDRSHAVTNVLVERSTLMQVGMAYALLDRFELGTHLPLYQQSGEGGPTGPPAKGTARGNLALHAKARLWRGDTGLGTFIAGASAIAVLPTASKDQFTGSDQPEARLLMLGSFAPAALGSRLAISVNAGPIIRGKSEYLNIVEKGGVAWGAGVSYRVFDELWATAELFGESTPKGRNRQQTSDLMPPPLTLSPIEWLAGLSIRPDRRVTFGLALGRGVTSAIGTPDLRGVFSLSVVPGAATVAPIHPPEPPKPDGDADGDGIPDSIDKCPNEPEDKDMFEDTDGCPDPDNDHDGIPDALDKCPIDPEDKDGFQDEDGCPDKDNDGDGIPDSIDKCPNDPEDKDGFEDLDGCPELDNDHDGIPDNKDKCPNEPETINGFQDDDGCPDKGDSMVILSPDRIETLDPIQFTGLKLTKASTPLLEQVAATLRAHTEIVRVRVTVYVQPTNDDGADQEKSTKRAQAVRDWFVNWGIAPMRIEARGFGGTKPLVPPNQRGAAKINDRIEFIILERK